MTDPIVQPSHVPFLRKLWVVVVFTCLILTFPIAMIVLLSGPVYRWRDHAWRPIGNGARYTYGGLLALWLVAVTAEGILQPGGMAGMWAASAPSSDTASAGKSETAPATEKPAAPSADNQAAADTPAAAKNHLNIQVSTKQTQYGEELILTNADEPFTLERIVFNGRAEEQNCDLPKYGLSPESRDTSNEAASMQSVYGTQLPVTVKVGERAVFFLGCGALVKFDLYTDHGLWHFTKPSE